MRVYPREKALEPIPDSLTRRKWIVEYNMIYDGGTSHWLQWYRLWISARLMAWWTYYISSWGGSVQIYLNEWPGQLPPGWHDANAVQ
jgi:hypothetical protein